MSVCTVEAIIRVVEIKTRTAEGAPADKVPGVSFYSWFLS
jgi:hypothetical protein